MKIAHDFKLAKSRFFFLPRFTREVTGFEFNSVCYAIVLP